MMRVISVFALLLAISSLNASCQRAYTERDHEHAAAATFLIRSSYTPSDKLSKLMPTVIAEGYVAKKLDDPAHCAQANDCWIVTETFRHKAAADNVIVARWAVDLKTMKSHPLNSEAETLFIHSPSR
jgi:hypothetical protein